ncbi:MAG TPA: hypothetical protein VJQ43_06360 [Thermoplasmata archaeon]|nr:hypothetical protein [Thermoplasmata archaeon]
MRIHKVINRVHEGTTYYRWVLSVPPKNVRDLGWVDGQELETIVRGTSLWVQPSVRRTPRRRAGRAADLEDEFDRRTVTRR